MVSRSTAVNPNVCSRFKQDHPSYDAERFGVKLGNMDDEWKFGQERAYTSPIWYTP